MCRGGGLVAGMSLFFPVDLIRPHPLPPSLPSRLAELKKVKNSVVSAEKKAIMAESKEPNKVEKRRKEVEEAKEREKEAQGEVNQKLLEVQQDKHETLRSSYTGLYQAQSWFRLEPPGGNPSPSPPPPPPSPKVSRLKELTEKLESMRNMVNAFPRVVSRNDEGENAFVLAPPDGPPVESPLWWQGEKFFEELEKLRKSRDAEIKRIKDEHQKKLDDMLLEQEELLRERSQSFNSEMSSSAAQNQALIAALKKSNADKLAEMEAKIQAMETAHKTAIDDITSRYTQQEKQLEKRKSEVLAHMRDEQRLAGRVRGSLD